MINNVNTSRRLLGSFSMLHSDLKIFSQLSRCNLEVSGEVIPVVHGNNFSPGYSLNKSGTNMMKLCKRKCEDSCKKAVMINRPCAQCEQSGYADNVGFPHKAVLPVPADASVLCQ